MTPTQHRVFNTPSRSLICADPMTGKRYYANLAEMANLSAVITDRFGNQVSLEEDRFARAEFERTQEPRAPFIRQAIAALA